MSFLYQDLDTPFVGSDEIPNPDGRRNIQRGLVAEIDHGWTGRFSTRLVLQGREIDARGRLSVDTAGLGDTELWGRVRLGGPTDRWSVVAAAGLALPTGREPTAALVNESAFFGAGDESLLLGLEGARPLGSVGTLFLVGTYRNPLGASSGGYRVGDDFVWTAAWSAAPASWRAGLVFGISGRHLGQDEENGVPVPVRGGRLHYANAGVTFPAGRGGRLAVVVQRLIEQRVRGDQLLAEWNAAVSWSRSWTNGAD